MRIAPKHDAATPMVRARTVWVLIQTLPSFNVLGASEDLERIKQEAAELRAVWTERRSRETFRYVIKPAGLLAA